MKEYKVKIQEILERTITLQADNKQDAIDKVTQQYNEEDIVLDASDFKGNDFKIIS